MCTSVDSVLRLSCVSWDCRVCTSVDSVLRLSVDSALRLSVDSVLRLSCVYKCGQCAETVLCVQVWTVCWDCRVCTSVDNVLRLSVDSVLRLSWVYKCRQCVGTVGGQCVETVVCVQVWSVLMAELWAWQTEFSWRAVFVADWEDKSSVQWEAGWGDLWHSCWGEMFNDRDGNTRPRHRASYHHGQRQWLRGAPRPLPRHCLPQLARVHGVCQPVSVCPAMLCPFNDANLNSFYYYIFCKNSTCSTDSVWTDWSMWRHLTLTARMFSSLMVFVDIVNFVSFNWYAVAV